jgi:hypothetical protein
MPFEPASRRRPRTTRREQDEKEPPQMPGFEALTTAIVAGDRATAVAVTRAGLEAGADPQPLLDARAAALDVVNAAAAVEIARAAVWSPWPGRGST